MSAIYRFGVYELDTGGIELRKNGIRIRLQEQPFRILTALVTRANEVVSREELKELIWANETFVDFDQSINKAVNRLREALNDNASQPRYIETIPRRGYRFVAAVATIGPIPPLPPTPAQTAPEVAADRPWHRPSRILPLAGTAIALTLVGVVVFFVKTPTTGIVSSPRLLIQDAFYPSLSHDGKLLAYVSTIGGDVPHIWVRQTAGGKPIQVTKGAFRDFGPDLSPDGTSILYWSERQGGGIYLTPTFPGETRLVLANANSPTFSPDGQTILCWGPKLQVLTLAVNKGQPIEVQPITRDYQVDAPPMWSPNSKDILFFGHRRGKSEVPDGWWIASLSGQAPRRMAIPELEDLKKTHPLVRSWARQGNKASFLTYSFREQDTWNLFRMAVSSTGAPAGKPEHLASGAGLLRHVASQTEDGKLAYTVTTVMRQIFEIPISKEGRKLGPTAELPLPEGELYYSPSLSRDGHWMVYIEGEYGKGNILILRDFKTGTDRVLTENSQSGGDATASLSPDGSKVVFSPYCIPDVLDCPSFLIATTAGGTQQICAACTARGFSSDGSFVLVQKYAGAGKGLDTIVAVDLATKRERVFLSDPNYPVYHPYLSWDNRWVVFKRSLSETKAQIVMAPVKDGAPAKRSEWIPITDGRHSDDKPQFSSDGQTVYFTSDRDGYLCIWSLGLARTTGLPVGSPTAYEHFHNAMGRDAASYADDQWGSDLTVARDKILIDLPRRKDDIWMLNINQ